jgi:hypothetical protein
MRHVILLNARNTQGYADAQPTDRLSHFRRSQGRPEEVWTAPIAEVRMFFDNLHNRAGQDIAVIQPNNAEPPTSGPTTWSVAPKDFPT